MLCSLFLFLEGIGLCRSFLPWKAVAGSEVRQVGSEVSRTASAKDLQDGNQKGARHHAFLNQGSLLDLRNKMLVKGFWGLWVQCCSPARSRSTGRRPSRVFHRYRCWQQPWACEEEEAAQGAQAGRSKSKSDRANSNTFNTKGPMQPAAHASK